MPGGIIKLIVSENPSSKDIASKLSQEAIASYNPHEKGESRAKEISEHKNKEEYSGK